ncbi:MAG: branched-chain amino acid transaminase [Acidobacteriota bacterium]
MQKTEKIWHNGTFIPWDDARIHVLSHVVHYASAVFEGIRCYRTRAGSAVFRLHDHLTRLADSAKIYRMQPPCDVDAMVEATLETLRVNRLNESYIRPIILRGYGTLGVDPTPCPVECYIAVWPWGAYLGREALEQGVDVMVSSWDRIAPNTLPAMAKAAANYMNAQLIKMEALANGYLEGIALDTHGYVSEGSGENLFLVRNGILYTPPVGASVLPGVTRDTVIRLGRQAGLQVIETLIPRESLYTADEIFLTGTAAEITPVRSVDRIPVGNGKRGEVSRTLQEQYFALVHGESEAPQGWLTPVGAVEQEASL